MWIHGYLLYILDYNLILLYFVAQVAMAIGASFSCLLWSFDIFWTLFCFLFVHFSRSLLSGTSVVPAHIVYFLPHSTPIIINFLKKKSLVPFTGTHCLLVDIASRPLQQTEQGNTVYICICFYIIIFYIKLNTNSYSCLKL